MNGKLLAFIDIFVESQQMQDVIDSLSKLESLKELYEVTGEFDLTIMVAASDIEELRDILKNKIMKVEGIKSTVISIVLKAYKGPKCQEDKPKLPAEANL
jgi:DNA-binding Lrp family transcriptional regulator